MIKRLKVTNFKIHKETEIFLGSPLAILTGENNSGKTSLLEALMIFSECYQHSLRKIQRTTNKKAQAGDLLVGQYDFLSSVFIPYFSSVRSENYYELFFQGSDSFELEADFEIKDVQFTLGFEVKHGRNQTAYNIESRVDNAALIQFNQFDPESLLEVIKSIPVASVMRNEPYMPPKMLAKQLAENAQVSTLRNRLLQINAMHKLPELQSQLQFIMGFDVFDLRVAFDPNEDLYITAEFRTDKKAAYQDIAMLGSGTLQMLEVLVSLNLAAKSACRMVLLDEPDSFLHRRLQQNLIAKLREIANNGVQVVCTTHNEQIIATAQLDELFHLGNPHTGQKVKSLSADLPKGRLSGFVTPIAKSGLYDALGVSASAMNILEAVEADRLVLVEGRTDALYLQAWQAKRQQLMPAAQPKKLAYWSINGIGDIANKLKYWKDIFSNINNGQSLWDKALLLLDSDSLEEQEMAEVAHQIKDHFGIETLYFNCYTLESSFLLDQARLSTLLANVFQLPLELVNPIYANWAAALTVDPLLPRIEGQRRARAADFAALNSSILAGMCQGNQYAGFIERLRADPRMVARIADKEAVFGLIKKVSEQSAVLNIEMLSDEALLLQLINQLDANTWQADWITVLKKIYG